MNTLIVAPSWIGDCVMAQPLLARLKEQEPFAAIDVLAADWVAPLFQRMQQVRQVIASPFRHGEFNLAGRWRLARQLRGAYDLAIILPNSWKSALLPWLAGIRERRGYHGEARYGLLNQRLTLDKQRHSRLVERYAFLAGEFDPQRLPAPRLESSGAQRLEARTQLGLPAGDFAVFCPGAEYGPAKRWPPAHFAALAQQIGLPVLLLGSAKDAAIGAEIAAQSAGVASNLCGQTTLIQALDLIAAARLVVSNDSGLMHIAAAFDKPLAALFGSSSPHYTPPLSPAAHIVRLALPCSPCFKRVCPLGHQDCLVKLPPERVMAVLR